MDHIISDGWYFTVNIWFMIQACVINRVTQLKVYQEEFVTFPVQVALRYTSLLERKVELWTYEKWVTSEVCSYQVNVYS